MSERESREPGYPWLRLLDYEAQRQPPSVEIETRRGRPPKPFKRKQTFLSLTDSEKQVLDELIDAFKENFDRSISRGQLVSFMAFWLKTQISKEGEITLPEGVNSFTSLANHLESFSSKE